MGRKQLDAVGAGVRAVSRAATTTDAVEVRVAAGGAKPLFGDAADALALLGEGPLRPTGPVADALAAGRLLRTRDAAVLDGLERTLRSGRIDDASRTPVGEGVNGLLSRVHLDDSVWAVEKPAGAQAAQEEFGWRIARELGIDHLFPAVARRANGTAYIEFRAGRGVTIEGITDVDRLEQALARHYLDDASLGLTKVEAAQAARIDRQLLQAFDYLLANNDRNAANALHDATAGVSYIDSGHIGRGALSVNGGTTLEPALQLFQAGREGGHVQLDDVVVDYIRRRLTPERIGELHAEVFHAPDMPGPPARTLGEKFIGTVRGDGFRDGIVQRREQLLETGGFTHRPYKGDAGGELPPLIDERLQNARGFRQIRGAFHGGLF